MSLYAKVVLSTKGYFLTKKEEEIAKAIEKILNHFLQDTPYLIKVNNLKELLNMNFENEIPKEVKDILHSFLEKYKDKLKALLKEARTISFEEKKEEKEAILACQNLNKIYNGELSFSFKTKEGFKKALEELTEEEKNRLFLKLSTLSAQKALKEKQKKIQKTIKLSFSFKNTLKKAKALLKEAKDFLEKKVEKIKNFVFGIDIRKLKR